MKFRLNLPRFRSTRSAERQSAHSIRRPKVVYDTNTVETWNELRLIGSQDVHRKLIDPTFQPTIDQHETQDWDYYIGQFNEEYRKQLKEDEDEKDSESISTIAETPSELMRSRERRLVVFRKLFIISNFLLWIIFMVIQNQWYLTFIIYPVGFLSFAEKDSDIFTTLFTSKAQWTVFLLNCHAWLVGCAGLLVSMCFREKPALLKQFILRVPYLLSIPLLLIFSGVRFTGVLSTQKLEITMSRLLSTYHDASMSPEDPVRKTAIRSWNQIQKILFCCGINGQQDWHSLDPELNDENTTLPETCCPMKFYRERWKKEIPSKDDCFYRINKLRNTDQFEWAYQEGCIKKAYEFYLQEGAFQVGIMFVCLMTLCASLVFGKQYYTLMMKNNDIKFKYHYRDWFREIIFLNKCRCTREKQQTTKTKKQKKGSISSKKPSEDVSMIGTFMGRNRPGASASIFDSTTEVSTTTGFVTSQADVEDGTVSVTDHSVGGREHDNFNY